MYSQIWQWCFKIYRPSKIFTGPGLLAVVFHKPCCWAEVQRRRSMCGCVGDKDKRRTTSSAKWTRQHHSAVDWSRRSNLTTDQPVSRDVLPLSCLSDVIIHVSVMSLHNVSADSQHGSYVHRDDRALLLAFIQACLVTTSKYVFEKFFIMSNTSYLTLIIL